MRTISVPEGLQTKTFVLESGAIQALPELLKIKFPGKRPWIIADENTWKAAGKIGAGLLKKAGFNCVAPYIFSAVPRLHPDYNYSKMLAEKSPANCIPVAVGSGVINDLTKCASGIKGIPYCCVPTACSVDGYTSAGAALSVNGTKKTVKCPAPCAVCADIDILATAPPEMLASGYADLLTKIPAGADWIIADTVGEEFIRDDVWQLIQGPIRKWVSDCTDMLSVFHGLAVTGYSMQMYHESRPASGSEHLFSHVWEMEGLQQNGIDISHGFKVGIGLLASTLLMEYVINHNFADIRLRMKEGLSVEERRQEIAGLLSGGCYGDAPETTAMKKFLVGEKLFQRRQFIEEKWEVLRTRLHKQLLPFETLRRMLKTAHCPIAPSEINLDKKQFLHGIRAAQLIRIRYTIIDLLYEMGLLDDAMLELEKML